MNKGRIMRNLLAILLMTLVAQGSWAQEKYWEKYFTDILLAGGSSSSVRKQDGWKSYDKDLNDGAKGDYIYLLYKQATEEHPAQGFITDFHVIRTSNPKQEFTEDGIKWELAPTTGSSDFRNSKGDLNNNAGGHDIFLYYTRTQFDDKRVVTGVYFNTKKAGSVDGYDLNADAGGDDIYMHVTYSNQGRGIFDTPYDAFTFNPNGRNCMHFKLLSSDYDPFRTLHGGEYYLKDENGVETKIFTVDEKNSDSNNDYVIAEFQNNLSEESTLFLTNSVTYSPKYLQITGNVTRLSYYRNDGKGKATGNAFAELDWYYPASLSGKTYTLCVKGTIYYQGGATETYNRDIGSISLDDVTLEAFDAIPSNTKGEENTVKIPVVSDHTMNWLQATYTNAQGQTIKVEKVPLKENSYSGFLLLPATDTHNEVLLSASITTASWSKDKLGESTYPETNTNVVVDTLRDVPMVHAPINFKSKVVENGDVQFNWEISDVDYPDLIDTDQFLIQRSLSGKDEDFKDLATIELDISQKDYSFKDSTLISTVTSEFIDATSGAPFVRYRLSRAALSSLWGYEINNTVQTTKPTFVNVSLLQPISATADWSNRDESKALVKWDYKPNDETNCYVWDDRAKMRLEVTMTNRNGDEVGKMTMELTTEQVRQKQIEVALTRSCIKYSMRLIVEDGTSPFKHSSGPVEVKVPADNFFYQNTGHIIPSSLNIHTRQSSALLEWNTDNGAIDYFIVRRHDRAKGPDAWETIATNLTNTEYEDKKTAPRHQYDYCVLAANDCEGVDYQSTDTIQGGCKNSGAVEGYVRFADGTGIPNIDVNISSTDGTTVHVTAKTDESGFFRKEDLPYWGNDLSGNYNIAPNINGYSDVRMITFGTEPGTNTINDVIMFVENNVRFTGYVLYNGTSIPVQGASFLVDGYEVHTAAGKVTSDFEGKFSFRMLPGKHIIQAVMDKHTFYQEGYYYAGGDTSTKEHNITTDVANVYFYDDTRVKLIGRVAGGKDQEAIPLGNSLSRNNLGDDLKMVFSLEGDKASRLVWDIQDSKLKECDEEFLHTSHDDIEYKTRVHTSLYRKEVYPDVRTGEYQVMLPPVKWKIEKITAQGYPTLFQDGHTSDVIDLTDSLTEHKDIIEGEWRSKSGQDLKQVEVNYNAIYNRIYHAPVDIEYKQISFDPFEYLGNRYYVYHGMDGNDVKMELARPVRKPNWPAGLKDSLMAEYTFGYPVFNVERSYPIQISATEKYRYNGSNRPDSIDVVHLSGGKVTIRNGFISSTHRDTLSLDSLGQYVYQVKAKAMPYTLSKQDALRTLNLTLEMDGTYYEAEPLRAYILNMAAQPGAKDVLSIGKPILVDILRDPPGSMSSATLSKGSTLSHSFTLGMDMKRGVNLQFGAGTSWNNWQGVGAGIWNRGGNLFDIDFDLIWNNKSEVGYNYTMNINTDISTSDNKYCVGADADVYLGINTNVIMTPAVTIGAINDSVYQTRKGEIAAGRMHVIAEGTDIETNKPLYLVSFETMAIGQEFQSTFVHSQKYITEQLIPELGDQCKALMFTGSKEEAQRQANATGQNVYMSLREPDDPFFGVVNMKANVELGETGWEIVYNDTCFTPKDGINYVIIKPQSSPNPLQDKVAHYFEGILDWAVMIAVNEREKLNATKLYKNFDVDGASGMSYSEEFVNQMTSSETSVNIGTNFTYGDAYAGALAGIDLAWAQFGTTIWAGLVKAFHKWIKAEKEPEDNWGEVTMPGWNFQFKINPVFSCDFTPTYGSAERYSRKEKFNIKMDFYSHLNFDVYYAETLSNMTGQAEWDDVWVNDRYHHYSESTLDGIHNNLSSIKGDKRTPRSFIYRTKGGATLRTWEGERVTMLYNPGTVLDARTKKIENPVIKFDKQSVSGVPLSEPARFDVLLYNDSEQPQAGWPFFYLVLLDGTNPNGASIMMDGMPLSGIPRTVTIPQGEVTRKTIEVYAGKGFDYEGITLRLLSQDDFNTYQDASFDVHYLQAAGGVNILMPGDKWIMNTDASFDSKRGWYLPIIINEFDKNQPNFDHIEFQYKETTRGDDYWTNLCSFYADSVIYKAASGTKEMIPANGNITTQFYGDGIVMEKGYDLRAVLFCRNGSGYLTSASKVVSGVKDTRRPTFFGNPEPKDGVLDAGENIIFNFSEPIEYNYLQETTNFEVKGETNENALEESVALTFDGKGFAQSAARRNFSDKNVTIEVMVKPDDTGVEMPIFSHGSDGHSLRMLLTADRRLRVTIDNNEVLVGKTQLSTDAFQRVALVLDRDIPKATLYTDQLEDEAIDVKYAGSGPLIFGATNQASISKRTHFSGKMLQGRVWYRTMDLTLLNAYGNQQLTGYEMGLADYYPMNEGSGSIAFDGAQGADLTLINAGWSLPRSMSLKLDFNTKPDGEVKGLKIKNEFMSRNQEQDYTLMFWFKTNADGRGALISNGSGRRSDVDSLNCFFIGFEGETLKYRANGNEQDLGDSFSDDRWHHYAMTMNHTRNVVNIYVDFKQRASFSTDGIGGMGGDHFYLGNMVWTEKGVDDDKLQQQNALSGYIDGLTLFEQALPVTLVEHYGKKGLNGREKGLVTYLDFCRQERQKDGTLLLVPYPLNKVVKLDADGNVSQRNDTVFVVPADQIVNYIDRTDGAPIRPYEELRDLNFEYVGSNHQLMVNINEPDSRINKRNVYVTISDIPDKNGNLMASPATVSCFIDLNPLRWSRRSLSVKDVSYGVAKDIELSIVNNSGANHTYTIENLPRWLKTNVISDVIGPKEERLITFTVSKDANVGTYDDIIYLTDENGLSEPLALSVEVVDDEPLWQPDVDKSQYSMTIVAKVRIGNEIITDDRDLVGVFDNNGNCLGSIHVDYDATTSESMAYLTVYADAENLKDNMPLVFKLWHFQTGKVMVLTPSETVIFKANGSVGTTNNPIVLTAGNKFIQQVDLARGWNWISFNVYSDEFRDGLQMLNKYQWKEGDMFVDDTNNLALRYYQGQWISNKGDEGLKKFSLTYADSYRVKSVEAKQMEVQGDILRQRIYRVIPVQKGWNYIGYSPAINLPVSTALSDYYDEAEDGDVIKSRTEFAMFSVTGDKKEWKGNLRYMKPGEGYMLKRKKETATSFTYAYYEPNSTYFDDGHSLSRELTMDEAEYSNTMSLTATVNGVEIESGDRLLAMNGAEIVGEGSVADDGLVYVSISGDKRLPLSFAIERGEDIIATTGEVLVYEPNGISGSPNEPTAINFVKNENTLTQEGWYTLQGVKLPKAPERSGVYILNGRKQVIR